MGMQVGRWLRSWATDRPAATALVVADEARRAVSYAEFDARACAIAGGFRDAGLVEGDRVALLGGNSYGFVATFLGALYAGLVVVPLPIASTRAEIRFRLAHAKVRALVHDRLRDELAAASAGETRRLCADALEGPAIDGPIDRPADADAMLLYTSGTTAAPKAARISHASLVAHTASIVHHGLRLGADDVVLGVLPLTHSYGARLALFAPMFAGARTILVERFDVDAVAESLAETTWFPGVPTMFSALGRRESIAAPRLRWCLSAGAALPDAVRIRAERTLGAPIREGYGLTEATFTTICSDPEDVAGIGTVGRPVPGVEVRIVDQEIRVRGQNLMTGYLDDDAATEAAFVDGFLCTGDLGEIDRDGRLRIVDRKKDLIVRGGFNVVPSEVEAAIVAVPGIAEALVVGVPDEHYGEELVAVVVRSEGYDAARLVSSLRDSVASTKRPRRIAYVDALPVGPSGKLVRRLVRDRLVSGELAWVDLVDAQSRSTG